MYCLISLLQMNKKNRHTLACSASRQCTATLALCRRWGGNLFSQEPPPCVLVHQARSSWHPSWSDSRSSAGRRRCCSLARDARGYQRTCRDRLPETGDPLRRGRSRSGWPASQVVSLTWLETIAVEEMWQQRRSRNPLYPAYMYSTL